MHRTADIQKRPHQFLPANFELTQWESLEPYFKALLDREITNKLTLESWLQDLSELEAFVSEDACWRQIKMTCDTTDKSLEAAFTFFCMEIQPKIQPYADALNKKLIQCPFTIELDEKEYFTYSSSFSSFVIILRRLTTLTLVITLTILSYPVVKNLVSPNQVSGKQCFSSPLHFTLNLFLLQVMNANFDPFRIVNTHGLFGSITKARNEVILQGTTDKFLTDQTKWQEFEFRCKPGDINR
jgi:hypothetical protein